MDTLDVSDIGAQAISAVLPQTYIRHNQIGWLSQKWYEFITDLWVFKDPGRRNFQWII